MDESTKLTSLLVQTYLLPCKQVSDSGPAASYANPSLLDQVSLAEMCRTFFPAGNA